MNCKPGDLAVYIKGSNAGMIVSCIRLADFEEVADALEKRGLILSRRVSGPFWLVDKDTAWAKGKAHAPYSEDQYLRPIRDPGEDAQDETLRWLPAPHRDEVPA